MTESVVKVSLIGQVVKLDEAGRLYLPRKVKKNMDLKGGDSFEVFQTEDKLLLLKPSKRVNNNPAAGQG